MCDEGRTEILERLPTSDMIVVGVAINYIFDRRLGNFPDFFDVSFCRRPPEADRIRRDDAPLGYDEHRLMVRITKDVDVVGTLDLSRAVERCLCQYRARRQ